MGYRVNDIETYAWSVVLVGAQSSIDSDLDEDGDLASEEEWRAALLLAQRILNEIEYIQDDIMKVVRRG